VKSFDFFSLDYVYYPVSGIMWVWHKAFGSVLGYNNAWAWVLSVVFLVFTLRSLLFKPFMGQMTTARVSPRRCRSSTRKPASIRWAAVCPR
jgi:YidC/Oxa1 family membrane protein insertase